MRAQICLLLKLKRVLHSNLVNQSMTLITTNVPTNIPRLIGLKWPCPDECTRFLPSMFISWLCKPLHPLVPQRHISVRRAFTTWPEHRASEIEGAPLHERLDTVMTEEQFKNSQSRTVPGVHLLEIPCTPNLADLIPGCLSEVGWLSFYISCPTNYTCQFEISISSPWPARGTCGPLTRPWSPSWGWMTSWFSISCPIQGWAKNHPATVCCQLSLSLFCTLQNSNQWKVGLQIWISCSYVPYVWCVQAI